MTLRAAALLQGPASISRWCCSSCRQRRCASCKSAHAPAAALCAPLQHTGHHGRACPRATGQRGSRPALPDHHPHVLPVHHLPASTVSTVSSFWTRGHVPGTGSVLSGLVSHHGVISARGSSSSLGLQGARLHACAVACAQRSVLHTLAWHCSGVQGREPADSTGHAGCPPQQTLCWCVLGRQHAARRGAPLAAGPPHPAAARPSSSP